MRAKAVIGAGYGDEGKGLLTDFLAAKAPSPATVVRANGGAQAGHTVVSGDGRRHVFHHMGAGAFADARTHLSRFFVSAPMLFESERLAVAAMGGKVGTTADPRGAVTTPYDVAVNQAVEIARGSGRHGSCGIGFGETVGRDLIPEFAIRIADLDTPELRGRLRAVRDGWLPARLAELGLGLSTLGEAAEIVTADATLERFVRDCMSFRASVAVAPDWKLGVRPVVFEGAQGLLLDQDKGAFPHVTRSNTGIRNMVDVATEAGLDGIDAVYVTRAYVTRHGAGPLAHEGDIPFDVVDPTNEPNAWQGTIRHAPLDLDVLREAIRSDLADAGGLDVSPEMAVTCIDQARGLIPFFVGGERRGAEPDAFPDLLAGKVGVPLGYVSRGPTRRDVARVEASAMAA